MAVTNLTIAALASSLFQDTANGAAAVAVKASAATVYYIEADNTANAALSYVKLYNATTGNVTVGTTAPDMILMIPASTLSKFPIPGGLSFATALTVASLTAGGTAGITAPGTAISVRVAYT